MPVGQNILYFSLLNSHLLWRNTINFTGFHISSFESLNINFQKSSKLFHLGNDLENSIVLQRTAVPNLEMKFIK